MSVTTDPDITGISPVPLTEILGGTGQDTYVKGDILWASAANVLSRLAVGSVGQVLKIPSASTLAWGAFTPTVVTLTDGATPALDASLGNVFVLNSTQNPTIAVPTNPTNGQKIIILFRASSAIRTLGLNTGAGGFGFGETITSLSATTANKMDAVGCVYTTLGSLNKWIVVAYEKGY